MDGSRFDDLSRLLGARGTRRSGLLALLGAALGATSPAAGASDARRREPAADGRRHAGGGLRVERRGKRRCRPRCIAPQECRKGACACPDGTLACGAACCAAGQRCRDGACAGPEPACIPFAEACKDTGRACCEGLACGSGQDGEADVACYRPAGASCDRTGECVYGTTCTGGTCVPDPSGGPTPTPVPLVCDVWAAGGAAALQAALDAPPASGVILVEPGVYAGDFTITGKTLTIQRCGDTGEAILRNVTSAPPSCVDVVGVCDRIGRTLLITAGAAPPAPDTLHQVILRDMVVECGTCPDGDGGGIFVSDVDLRLEGGTQIRGNTRPRSDVLGGGVMAMGTDTGPRVTVTVTDQAIVRQNEAPLGGGIAIYNNVLLTIDGSAWIDRNRATFPAGSGKTAKGAGVFSGLSYPDSRLEVRVGGAARITGNEAPLLGQYDDSEGGGLALTSDTVATIEGTAEISGNVASTGGGVSCQGPLLVRDSVRIENNRLGGNPRYGGGLFVSGESARITGDVAIVGNTGRDGAGLVLWRVAAMTIDGRVRIGGNTATGDGGGVAVLGGGPAPTIEGNARVTGNTAARGGGVFADASDVTIQGSVSVDGNTATRGGGIAMRGAQRKNFTVLLAGASAVSGNVATGGGKRGGGGGIWARGGTLTMEASAAIRNNEARTANSARNAQGGGVRMIRGVLDVTSAAPDAIRGNSAQSATSGTPGNGVGGFSGGERRSAGLQVTVGAPAGGLISIVKSDNLPYRCGGADFQSDCSGEP